jgi:hypothetical protein
VGFESPPLQLIARRAIVAAGIKSLIW